MYIACVRIQFVEFTDSKEEKCAGRIIRDEFEVNDTGLLLLIVLRMLVDLSYIIVWLVGWLKGYILYKATGLM